jgi:predicted nucleic acid-binding protein
VKGKILVCDASPIILMAKLQVLNRWLQALGVNPVVVPEVIAELGKGPFAFGEESELRMFLGTAETVRAPESKWTGGGLSPADIACLTCSPQHTSSLLLADDRLLRRAARYAGVDVVGLPGLLIQAVRLKFESPHSARHLLDEAIRTHSYRISISLYQTLLRKIEPPDDPAAK